MAFYTSQFAKVHQRSTHRSDWVSEAATSLTMHQCGTPRPASKMTAQYDGLASRLPDQCYEGSQHLTLGQKASMVTNYVSAVITLRGDNCPI
jgi:hypothetical protein